MQNKDEYLKKYKNLMRIVILNALLIACFLAYFHTSDLFPMHHIQEIDWDHTRYTGNVTFLSDSKCLGDLNDIENTQKRICSFSNICYRKNTSRFEYYTKALDETERHSYKQQYALFFDYQKGPILDREMAIVGPDAVGKFDIMSQSAVLADDQFNLTSVEFLPGTFVYRERQQSPNLGHVLYDVVFGYYMALVNLGEEINPTSLHLLLTTKDKAFLRFLSKFSGYISSNPVMQLNSLVGSSQSDLVCFEKFIFTHGSGVAQHAFRYYDQDESVNWFKSHLYFDFRNLILKHHNLDPLYVPNKHQITIFNKTYPHAKAHKFPRRIEHLDEIVELLESRYTDIPINAVRIAEYSFQDQLALMLNTTILITPPGGISTLIPFLPPGAHVIVLDYPSLYGHRRYKKGASVSMEAELWDALPHVNADYYQIRDETDWRWPSDLAKKLNDPRRSAVVNIKIERMEALIDRAIHQMQI